MHVREFFTEDGFHVSYLGPPLEDGYLPCVFYFALSALDSLTLDPYNQPALELAKDNNLRVFSVSLPGHEPPLLKENAFVYWAENVMNNNDILTPFLHRTCRAIEYLQEKDYIRAETTVVMGLSRGGFIAAHIAAMLPSIDKVIAFAPVTKIEHATDFREIHEHPIVRHLSLSRHMQELCKKKICFYIGNRDERVGTKHCFDFISSLADLKFKLREKKGSYKLNISDSIGFMGHGTSPEVFKEGADYAKSLIL
ncbi:alpha/beta hydrolase [Candidatus Aerophobetes bacterium]|uniref:Alpha/beta hydrolase n=1 Tax=Aerophobetes bacterium TaxID=2030807 RepID=A0A2A4YLI0_UNCAE|nr:MAG: alpha/beta hydrolase [Candidatus Aerophobetes bacterium]